LELLSGKLLVIIYIMIKFQNGHIVLISDHPITLPIEAYYKYNDEFLCSKNYYNSGLSKYLNKEFLDGFIDSGFVSHLIGVKIQTGVKGASRSKFNNRRRNTSN